MQKIFEGEITLGFAEALFANAIAFILIILGGALFLSGGATYVDMKVVSVETDLPINFLDSPNEGRGDILYYLFELQPQKPLTLVEVRISNEKEFKSLKYFEPHYNVVGLFGEPLSDFVVLLEESSDGFSQNKVNLYSRTRLMAHDTLEPHYWYKESELGVEYFHEDDLNVLFVFEEGTVNVRYKFLDREIMHPPLIR